MLEAKIPDEKRTSELFPLLEDEPFRVVVQQGLVDSTDYDEVVQCLRRQYDPEGNEFEFHCRFQQRVQSSGEKLTEFVGALRFLADKVSFLREGYLPSVVRGTATRSGETSIYSGFTFLVHADEAHAGEP